MNPSLAKYLWLLPVALALAVNLNVLRNGFVWDDVVILAGQTGGRMAAEAPSREYYRPTVSWSYRLDRRLWGSNPAGFHLTNLLLHGMATLLVVRLGLLLFSRHRRRIAFASLAGFLFAVHPVHAEAAAWIAGRNDLLPGLLLLVAAFAHLSLRRGANGWWTLPLFTAGLVLAVFAKESAVPLLLVFPIIDCLEWRDSRPGWRKLISPSTGIVTVLIAGYFWFRTQSLGSPAGDIPMSPVSLAGQVRLLLLAAGFYVKDLVWPYPLNAFIMLPAESSAGSYGLMILGGLSALFLGIATLRRRPPLLVIGLWTVALGLAAPLGLSLTRITHVPVAERYLYLPSIGFAFLAAGALVRAYDVVRRRFPVPATRTAGIVFIAALIGVLFAASFQRNSVWRNEQTLWSDTAGRSPNAALPHNRLGRAYADAGKFPEAEREFQRALEGTGRPEIMASAANNLAATYLKTGKSDLAEAAFKRALQYQDTRSEPHFGLGFIYWNRARSAIQRGDPSADGLLQKAREHLMSAILRDPGNFQAYHALGMVDLALNQKAQAAANFRKVVELNPDSPLARDAYARLIELGAGSRE
jgi:Tfp pilus assembly protein PilF